MKGVIERIAVHELKIKPGDWNHPLGGSHPSVVHLRSRLSHLVRRASTRSKWFCIDTDELEKLRLDDLLPSPQEQLDDLVLWTADNQRSPAEEAPASKVMLSAWLGTLINRKVPYKGLEWLADQKGLSTLMIMVDPHI